MSREGMAPSKSGIVALSSKTQGATTLATSPGGGYGPPDLQSAYNLPSSTNGSGMTVAIVDAYDDPNAESDLGQYRSYFGLPSCTTANGCFKKVNQNGGTSYPTADTGWAGEIALDLDMVSAACPNCKIVLVEANSASFADLDTAENQAAAQGAQAISNSFGGSEINASDNAYNHSGVGIFASSGDSGYGASQPCSYSTVTCVGGTSLTSSAGTWSETAWTKAGSGCSAYVAKPSWQNDTGCTARSESDIATVADPNTGVAVYLTYGTTTAWHVYGGTSAASPLVAGIYALAGSSRVSNPAQSIWNDRGAHTRDVTSGSNGTCSINYICNAGPGYDGPTGWGSPQGISVFSTGPAPTPTPGSTPTPTPPPSNCSGQLFLNPGFESGQANWTTTSGVINTDGAYSHTGVGYAWLDGYGYTHTDTLSQAVTIPAGCKATLSYWLRIDTAETSTYPYDTLKVTVNGTTVQSFSNANHGAYAQRSVDISSYAGSTVTIKWTGSEDSSLATSFFIDDTSVALQ